MSFIYVVLEESLGKKIVHKISFNGLMMQTESVRETRRDQSKLAWCLKIFMGDLKQSSAMAKSRNLTLI